MNTAEVARRARLARKAVAQRLSPAGEVDTIIVAGCQRSGTNMVMDLLERHADTRVFHERDSRAYDNYLMRDLGVIRQLHTHCRARFFVIKALCELHMLKELMNAFPPARVLWVVRRWPDVVNSLVRSFDGFSGHLQAIAHDRCSAGWRGLGMSDVTHEIVRTVAARDPDELSSAAMQWYFRNQLFFELGLDRDPRVRLISYESLVSAPVEIVQDLCNDAGLPFQEAMVADVSPRSIGRNPLPPVDPAVVALCDQLYQHLDQARS